MRILISFLLLFSLTSNAANVRNYFISATTGEVDTNALIIRRISTNILASGGVIAQGIPIRAPYSPCTNFLAQGFYSVSNVYLRAAYVINVDDNTSTLYDYTNLLHSGFNTYVTPGTTRSAITNALGFMPQIASENLTNWSLISTGALISADAATKLGTNSGTAFNLQLIGTTTNSGFVGLWGANHQNLDHQNNLQLRLRNGLPPRMLWFGDNAIAGANFTFANGIHSNWSQSLPRNGSLVGSGGTYLYTGGGGSYVSAAYNNPLAPDDYWGLEDGESVTNLTQFALNGIPTTLISFWYLAGNGFGTFDVNTNVLSSGTYGAQGTVTTIDADNGGALTVMWTNIPIPLASVMVSIQAHGATNIVAGQIGQMDTNKWAGFVSDFITVASGDWEYSMTNAAHSNWFRAVLPNYDWVGILDKGSPQHGMASAESLWSSASLPTDLTYFTSPITTNSQATGFSERSNIVYGVTVNGRTAVDVAPLFLPVAPELQTSLFADAIHLSSAGQAIAAQGVARTLGWTQPQLAALGYTNRFALNASSTLNADNITSGTVADARVASTIARDSEVQTATNNLAGALGALYQAKDTDLDSVAGGITGIVLGAGNGGGYSAAAGTDIVGAFTGTPDGSKFLADDGTLKTPAGSGDAVLANDQTFTGSNTFNGGVFITELAVDDFSATTLGAASFHPTNVVENQIAFGGPDSELISDDGHQYNSSLKRILGNDWISRHDAGTNRFGAVRDDGGELFTGWLADAAEDAETGTFYRAGVVAATINENGITGVHNGNGSGITNLMFPYIASTLINTQLALSVNANISVVLTNNCHITNWPALAVNGNWFNVTFTNATDTDYSLYIPTNMATANLTNTFGAFVDLDGFGGTNWSVVVSNRQRFKLAGDFSGNTVSSGMASGRHW